MEDQERLTQALVDRYRIEREIGSGGRAAVRLTEDLKHHCKGPLKGPACLPQGGDPSVNQVRP